ncbi:tubulin binding cofactor C-domain-containing protein [Cladochytrium replicatum]|nr:tubulin binding cofactor C-domain-containing protein [Cladochytrium replicatum]
MGNAICCPKSKQSHEEKKIEREPFFRKEKTSQPSPDMDPSGKEQLATLKPDWRDFVFHDLNDATVVKLPGSVPPDMPLSIEDSRSSSVFIFDCSSQVTVDACSDCFMFIGPCCGSIFLRSCRDCVVVCIAQQLRLRECKNMNIFTFSSSHPVLESSFSIQFRCFRYSYSGLEEQLRSAGLSIFRNEWSNIYDFTASGAMNWSIHEDDVALCQTLYKSPPPEVAESLGVDLTYTKNSCLAVRGRLEQPPDSFERICLFCGPEPSIISAIKAIVDNGSVSIGALKFYNFKSQNGNQEQEAMAKLKMTLEDHERWDQHANESGGLVVVQIFASGSLQQDLLKTEGFQKIRFAGFTGEDVKSVFNTWFR